MQVLYSHCAGLDVHKKAVSVCVWITSAEGRGQTHHQQFGTTTPDLLELAQWLQSLGVTHVAMESTGVYWRPIYEVLEGGFTLVVVNARHAHVLPGRKTDTGDAQWLGDLLRHGLLKASYVPPRWQRELRELVRYRRNLSQRRTQVVNELHKTLELANLKLASVVSDVTGASATDMLQHLVAGQGDPQLLSELSRGSLRKKKEALCRALTGRVRDHHRFMISQHLAEISGVEEDIRVISEEIERRTAEQQELIDRLDAIPGINRRVAEVIIAEMGTDPSVFGNNVERAMAWAGVCPGNNETGGKRHQARIRQGNRTLTTAAVEAALAAIRSRKTYFHLLYRRLAGRRGHKRAVVAVAHAILKTVFMMILRGTTYQDLGADDYDRLRPQVVIKKLTRRIRQLGFEVQLNPKPAPA